jgi:hypothetical protein
MCNWRRTAVRGTTIHTLTAIVPMCVIIYDGGIYARVKDLINFAPSHVTTYESTRSKDKWQMNMRNNAVTDPLAGIRI